jgi:ribonuclease HI
VAGYISDIPCYRWLQPLLTGSEYSRTPIVCRYRVNPNLLESVNVVRQPPYWMPPFTVEIPRKKEDARLDDEVRDIAGETRLYSDGSSHDGGVGAAACIIRPDGSTRALRLHLGRDLHYTVHAAESVGLLLATHLLETEAELPRNEISIGIDNHALLKGASRYRHAYGQWATDEFRERAAALAARTQMRLVLRWTPGHIGIAGNELVDEHAKRAANGAGESSEQVDLPAALLGPLPRSAAAIQQAFNARTRGRAIKRWKRSSRYNRVMQIDSSMPSKKYLDLLRITPRNQSTALIWLRTGWAPLRKHLYSINAGDIDSPTCASCDIEDETVRHFLLDCPTYEDARRRLRAELGHRKAGDIRFLLRDWLAKAPLMKYLDATARWTAQLGTLVVPPWVPPAPAHPVRADRARGERNDP